MSYRQKRSHHIFILIALASLVIFLSSCTGLKDAQITQLNDHEFEGLLVMNHSERRQTIVDFDKNKLIKVENLTYLQTVRDSEGKYWISTPGPDMGSDSQLDIYSPNGKRIKTIDLKPEMPLVLEVSKDIILLGVLAVDTASRVYLYNLIGDLLDIIAIDSIIWDIKSHDHTVFIAGHDSEKNIGKIYAYDRISRELSVLETAPFHAPLSLETVFNYIIWANYDPENGQGYITLFDLRDSTQRQINVPHYPRKIYYNQVTNQLFVHHLQVGANAGNKLSSINLDDFKLITYDVPVNNGATFSDEFIYLIFRGTAQKMEKYDLQMQLLDTFYFDFNPDHSVIIPGVGY